MSYRLTFAGCGSAFSMVNYQSNMILWRKDHVDRDRLLIDCGSDARFSLNMLGLTHRDISAIYVSHLHADHVGGLEWIGFSTKFDLGCEKPKLFVPGRLVAPLWQHVLIGGMGSLQGEVADLSSYFDLQRIDENGHFWWVGAKLHTVQTIHIYDGYSLRSSYGLMMNINGRKIYLTTDTQYAPEQIRDFYEEADLIFQDCETSPFASRVHAHYGCLCGLPETTKQKMWLYHYNDGDLPDAEADGFLGFVERGQTFDLMSGLPT